MGGRFLTESDSIKMAFEHVKGDIMVLHLL